MSELARELVEMAAEDGVVRSRLANGGTLHDGYHPEMERLHVRHGQRLAEIIDEHGWPDTVGVGAEAAEAAWLILQHAISMPELQRRGLELMRASAEEGKASAIHVAMLEDRIRVFEGRPQVYGTQLDWGEDGELSPHPIEDSARVDERRERVGLDPLEEAVLRKRQEAVCSAERPPTDRHAKRERYEGWLRRVGWRE